MNLQFLFSINLRLILPIVNFRWETIRNDRKLRRTTKKRVYALSTCLPAEKLFFRYLITLSRTRPRVFSNNLRSYPHFTEIKMFLDRSYTLRWYFVYRSRPTVLLELSNWDYSKIEFRDCVKKARKVRQSNVNQIINLDRQIPRH